MFRLKHALYLVGVVSALVFTGCGGGGGGGETSSVPTLPTVSAVEANATAENGLKALNSLIYGTSAGIPIPPVTVATADTSTKTASSFDPVRFMLDYTDEAQKAFTGGTVTPSSTLYQQCTYGGTISIDIHSNTLTHKDATFIFDNCAEFEGTSNGNMRIMADSPDGFSTTLTYMKILFETNFTISSSTTMMIYAGSYIETYFTTFVFDGPSSGSTTSSAQWTVDSETGRYDNLTSKFNDDGGYGAHDECYKMGRMYIDNLTYYLDINSSYDPNCNDPFTWQNYILTSGSMQLIGADSKVIDVNVTSDNNISITDSFGGSANLLL